MKAAIFQREKHIEIQELPDPKPARDEVLVRVVACGVCGTDVHIYAGQLKQGIKPPVVLGHEIAGVVETVGPDVGNVKVGQNVAIDPVITCGSCQYCHQARPNLCPDMTTIGYVRNGGYAQFTVVPATHVYPLGPQTPAQAAILVETLACVLNGYDKLSPRPGRTAMVLGAGTVGLLWNQLLRKSPITKLIQSEPVAFRRRRAQQIGADLTVDPTKEDLTATILQADPEGIDYVIDASGDPHAVAEGIRLVKKGGTFMIFGVCPADSQIRINPHDIYQKEMRIISSKMPPYGLHRAAEMIEAGMIDYEKLVTDTLPLSCLAEAFDMFEAARDRQIKIAINPWAD